MVINNYLRSALTRLDTLCSPQFELFKSVLDQNINSIRNSFVAGSAGHEPATI